MTRATVDGTAVGYELVGDGRSGRSWVLTPGGRFPKEFPGVRELAEALAEDGDHVLLWDRPNCGESDVRFDGDSESAMQADVLAGLLRELDLAPSIIAGGSGGARVSLLAAARHPDVAAGVATWWISGGTFGLLSLAVYYCGESLQLAWTEGMGAVADSPQWAEVVARNPANRDRIASHDRGAFIDVMDRWMRAYCACGDETVPGLPDADLRALDVPALVFRSGESDVFHTRATSEAVAALLPRGELVEPPWGDREWIERSTAQASGGALFGGWPQLAPQLLEWADRTVS